MEAALIPSKLMLVQQRGFGLEQSFFLITEFTPMMDSLGNSVSSMTFIELNHSR
jgi:hypothetical protein